MHLHFVHYAASDPMISFKASSLRIWKPFSGVTCN
jgi:hypothetical protein